ncbi:MAG: hypothetical protein JSV22_12340 [Bacteroidales bacterium]|nr:MAG: hypothetical protein JSV22_12340 [Bacteroidales bacterium]
MNTNENTSKMKERKAILSTLWIFVSVNYIFCDLLSNMEPEFLKALVEGGEVVGSQPITQEFLLGAAILVEISFIMIILSRVLKYGVNRWMNIIAGTIMTLVQIGSFFVGPPTLHYIFFSVIEITCTLIIIWYAWTWRNT